jgi:hypothetical protein
MRAYKTLNDGRSPFIGVRWPLPDARGESEWVRAEGPLVLCSNGIHASTTEQLPHWLGMELWEVELGGEILTDEAALLASQARLIRRIDAWDEPTRQEFARWCQRRAEEITEGYPPGAGLVAKVGHTIWWGGAAPAGYFTAMLAGESVSGRHDGPEYDAAFLRERALQADWLREALGLED